MILGCASVFTFSFFKWSPHFKTMSKLLYPIRKKNTLKDRCKLLREKIEKMSGPDNAALVYTSTYDHILEQSQIKFICQQWLPSAPKPQVVSTFRKTDVFLKPFEPGLCIEDDLTAKHTLLFNKFPVRRNHVLIITKEKRQQTDLLNQSDFEAICLTMKSLDESFAFYNAGEKAGSS